MSERASEAPIHRAARVLCEMAEREGHVYPGSFGIDWDTSDAFVEDARKALAAALDVEEMARVLESAYFEASARPVTMGMDGLFTVQAEALRAAILGGAA